MSQRAQMHLKTNLRWSHKAFLFGLACAALFGGSASASIITTQMVTNFAGASASFGFKGGSDFTFSDVRGTDQFNPIAVAVVTSGNAAVTSFFGDPTSFFYPARDFVEFGPATPFTSFSTPTAIPFSLSTFAIGIADTVLGQTYFGYAVFDGVTLNSYSFETTPGVAIVEPVPLPPSAPMFGAALLVLGAAGYAAKRKKAAAA